MRVMHGKGVKEKVGVVRYPQPKLVHIYRLIAKNTSDVFLNNNSFGKEAIQQAFLGATPKMRECAPHYIVHS